MLKTLAPTEPRLVKLCREKTWIAVAHRSESHPEEAIPSQSAARGAGTTALAIAVRSSAPIETIQSLIQANAHQLEVFHEYSGSIMHEALKHRSSYSVLRLLLQTMIHHERLHHSDDGDYLSLLARRDRLGRVVLHEMVFRAMHQMDEGMWILFRSIVLAYPPAVQIMDCDGNTPLVLALLLSDFNTTAGSPVDEAYLHRMIQLMLITRPSAATIARKLKPEWKQKRDHDSESSTNINTPSTIGDGSPNPLSYAILYGRSQETIGLLLDAHVKVGVNACLTLVSGYREVPLHLAASLRCPGTILSKLLEHAPTSIEVRDMNHLTPLDWMWIRHAVDWCQDETRTRPLTPSTRRYLSPHFASWHERATNEVKNASLESIAMQSLLNRMRTCLPAAARTANAEPLYKRGEPWSLLHSACLVSCPIATVRLAHRAEPCMIFTRDLRAGRLPLHYAAARGGYRITIPVGVSREVRTIAEPSPVVELASLYPNATRVADFQHQLPLHIAIDTCKKTQGENEDAVKELLRIYPGALERRDGKTKLYPYLQVAANPGASLDLVYTLLRPHPTLVASGTPEL